MSVIATANGNPRATIMDTLHPKNMKREITTNTKPWSPLEIKTSNLRLIYLEISFT